MGVNVKEELHDLVDRLGDERAGEALAYLRGLISEGGKTSEPATARLNRRTGPHATSGRAFFSQPPTDLTTLAAQQGVRPVTNFADLLGDFWPDDETADQFVAAVHRWRREGGYA